MSRCQFNKNAMLIIFFFVAGISTVFSSGGKEEKLTIYYTSSLNGNIDGCECVSHPRSGLVKSAAFLRTRDMENSILLDTGDMFDVYKDTALSKYILSSYKDLGYNAICIGDQEFSNGIPELLQFADEYPFFADNLLIKSGSDENIFKSPLIKTSELESIGLISLIDPDVFFFYPDEIKDNIFVLPVLETARRIEEELTGSGVSFIIVLYHGSITGAEELSVEVDNLDIIIAGHEQRLVDGAKSGNSILLSPGEDGNRVGILNITASNGVITGYENSFRLFDYMTDPDDPDIRETIIEYHEKLRLKKSD